MGRRKIASVSILALALLLVAVTPGYGQRRGRPGPPRVRPHGRVLINVGPFWGRPYMFPPPPVVVQQAPVFVHQPPVIVQQPPVIVQQPPVVVQQAPSVALSPGSAAAPPQEYWYFCPSARAYYPTVPDCPEEWILVPARS